MHIFKEHIMAYLNGALVNKQGTNLEKYKHIMENKFLVELNGSSQYNNLWNSEGFSECLNVRFHMQLHTYYNGVKSLIHKKDKAYYSMKVVDLCNKISQWEKISNFFLKKKVNLAPWMEESI